MLTGITLTLVVVGFLAEWLYLHGRQQVPGLVDLGLRGSAIGKMVSIVWAAIPRSRLGLLLVLASAAWFMGTPRDPGTEIGGWRSWRSTSTQVPSRRH